MKSFLKPYLTVLISNLIFVQEVILCQDGGYNYMFCVDRSNSKEKHFQYIFAGIHELSAMSVTLICL